MTKTSPKERRSTPLRGSRLSSITPNSYPFETLAGLPPQDRAKFLDQKLVLAALTLQDGDVVGNVAYSIYRQHKHDWLEAFQSAYGRSPDDNETASFVLSEITARRVAAYRFLASATLSGKGLELSATPGLRSFAERGFHSVSQQVKRERERSWILNVGGIVVVMVLAAVLVVRFALGS